MGRKRLSRTEVALLIAPSFALLMLGMARRVPGQSGGHEGFYVSRQQHIGSSKYVDYVRLYEDGVVLHTGASGTPAQVRRWLDTSQTNVSQGVYYIDGDSIRFSASSPQGTVDFQGRMRDGSLQLHSYSHINGHRGYTEYRLMPTTPLMSSGSGGHCLN